MHPGYIWTYAYIHVHINIYVQNICVSISISLSMYVSILVLVSISIYTCIEKSANDKDHILLHDVKGEKAEVINRFFTAAP